MEIYQPATSEQKSAAIKMTLEAFYSPLDIRVDVGYKFINPSDVNDDGQYWIFIDLFIPTAPDQKERPTLRQNYMTEVDKLAYGALQRRDWRFDSFTTDQGDTYDCVLTKVFFTDEKVEKIRYKKI